MHYTKYNFLYLKKSIYFKTLLITVLLFVSNLSKAQTTNWDSLKHTLPISIAVLDESISIPNHWFLEYEYNPAFIIGTEHILKKKPKSDWHLTANIGFYYHKSWEMAPFINSEIGYRYNFSKRFALQGRFGLGYLHLLTTKPVYTFEDDIYIEKTNFGSPTLLVSLSAGCDFKLNTKINSPSIFLTYMSSVKIPFSIYNGLNQFVGLGYKFYPFTQKNNDNTALQTAVDKLTEHIVGAQVAVIKDDKLWIGKTGMADIPNAVALENCHKTMVGSISKLYTTALIYQLQDEGLLSIDDLLSKHLDQNLISELANANEVTIKQMLNHTSGIPDYLNIKAFVDAINIDNLLLTQEEKLEYAHGKNATNKPGETYSYSNSNYVLLGLLIEKLRQMDLWDAVDVHIAQPLNLVNTKMGTEIHPLPEGTARPYIATRDGKFIDIYQNSVADAATGDGGIATNMQDLALFIQALFKGQLTSTNAVQQMLELTEVSENFDAGNGIEIFTSDNGRVGYGHSGSTSAYNAFAIYFPVEQTTVVFGFNAISEQNTALNAMNQLADDLTSILFE